MNDLGHIISYDFKEEGFHYIYAVRKYVSDRILHVEIAKAERLSHKCMNGHKSIRSKMKPLSHNESAELEIVRKRIKQENFHSIMESGENIELEVLYRSEPLSDCSIRLISEEDWIKKLKTNNEGQVEFQILSDYFSDFKELEKKKIHRMLLAAEHKVDSTGVYDGESFSKVIFHSSMEMDYIPSKTLYNSSVWGLITLVGSILFFSLALIVIRRRRARRLGIYS